MARSHVSFPLIVGQRKTESFLHGSQRLDHSPFVSNRVVRVKREISFCVCRFAIDFSGELAIVLSTDSGVKKGYFPFCFSFNRKLDRRVDIVHDSVRLAPGWI